MRFLLKIWRRWRLRNELYDDQPDRHPALAAFQKNELIPLKGTHFRVAELRELPIPVLILVPVLETKASQLQAVRKLRRADRILGKQELAARVSLGKRAY